MGKRYAAQICAFLKLDWSAVTHLVVYCRLQVLSGYKGRELSSCVAYKPKTVTVSVSFFMSLPIPALDFTSPGATSVQTPPGGHAAGGGGGIRPDRTWEGGAGVTVS